MPTIAPMRGPQTPAAATTMSAGSSPRSVMTARTRPSSVRTPVTVCSPRKRAPPSAARRACASDTRTASVRPSDGTWYAPTIRDRSRNGHSCAVSSGSITRPARPQDSAKSRRRWSSARRSGVSASSRLPTGFRHHRPSSSSDAAFSIVYIAKPCIVFDAFVWKMIPGAWLVEPPVLNSPPCSTTVTSVQPRRTSSSAREQPTMPAPMITTRGVRAMVAVRIRGATSVGRASRRTYTPHRRSLLGDVRAIRRGDGLRPRRHWARWNARRPTGGVTPPRGDRRRARPDTAADGRDGDSGPRARLAGAHPTGRGRPRLRDARKDRGAFYELLEAEGYTPDKRHNALFGGSRRISSMSPRSVRSTCSSTPRDVPPVRVRQPPERSRRPTLPLAELLLSKLQVVKINRKDVLDALILLAEHPLARMTVRPTRGQGRGHQRAADPVVHLERLGLVADGHRQPRHARPIPRDRAARRTTSTSTTARAVLFEPGAQIAALRTAIEDAPKSTRWKLRARVGERQIVVPGSRGDGAQLMRSSSPRTSTAPRCAGASSSTPASSTRPTS